ncbi:ScbA/BarX family gamma-butyrolactone biosynthesis protein [Streptomyces sp. NBC_01483]|uniref:ScbA/BarX family gamma-butyrolactone biosynthesis protein n=1 Tax=Streptomyces sp. NBC_01483 TaxID=2903883 RepID=UPI002E3775F3|nr:ScbA/BarX family gamma-butyrolactone biosynthesis protein [Streptomyces sp. NBC_01483]
MSASTFRMNYALPGAAPTESETTPLSGAGALLFRSLTTTVPKELVHRASVAEVMLTDWARVDDHRFAVAAQWPRGHSFFAPVDDCHDPLIAAETIRQAGVLLAHAEYGVPLGHHFLVSDLSVAVRPQHVRVGWTPASLELDVRCVDIKERGGAVTGFRIVVEIYRDGSLAATGGGALTCITPRVYQRLRAARLAEDGRPRVIALTAPETPQSVGRMSPTDVVLSPVGEPNRWQLRVDTRHPTLFDHMVDHVPGMVLLEAARQAAAATLGHASLPLAVTSEFQRYVELDAPCVIEACRVPGTGPAGAESVLVTACQDGAPVFRCAVTMAPPSA